MLWQNQCIQLHMSNSEIFHLSRRTPSQSTALAIVQKLHYHFTHASTYPLF